MRRAFLWDRSPPPVLITQYGESEVVIERPG